MSDTLGARASCPRRCGFQPRQVPLQVCKCENVQAANFQYQRQLILDTGYWILDTCTLSHLHAPLLPLRSLRRFDHFAFKPPPHHFQTQKRSKESPKSAKDSHSGRTRRSASLRPRGCAVSSRAAHRSASGKHAECQTPCARCQALDKPPSPMIPAIHYRKASLRPCSITELSKRAEIRS